MRKFISLKALEQKNLFRKFPNIRKVDACEDEYSYTKVAVSYFDHWLSKNEASKLFDNVSLEEIKHRKERQLDFCRQLVLSTSVLNYRVLGRPANRRVQFRAFSSVDAALGYCSDAYDRSSSRFFFKLVLPEHSALYYQGYDATNYLYFREGYLSEKLKSLVLKSDLHILTC